MTMFRTGDLVRLMVEGIRILGRAIARSKSAAFRIELGRDRSRPYEMRPEGPVAVVARTNPANKHIVAFCKVFNVSRTASTIPAS